MRRRWASSSDPSSYRCIPNTRSSRILAISRAEGLCKATCVLRRSIACCGDGSEASSLGQHASHDEPHVELSRRKEGGSLEDRRDSIRVRPMSSELRPASTLRKASTIAVKAVGSEGPGTQDLAPPSPNRSGSGAALGAGHSSAPLRAHRGSDTKLNVTAEEDSPGPDPVAAGGEGSPPDDVAARIAALRKSFAARVTQLQARSLPCRLWPSLCAASSGQRTLRICAEQQSRLSSAPRAAMRPCPPPAE